MEVYIGTHIEKTKKPTARDALSAIADVFIAVNYETHLSVIPAKAGIQCLKHYSGSPIKSGMTNEVVS